MAALLDQAQAWDAGSSSGGDRVGEGVQVAGSRDRVVVESLDAQRNRPGAGCDPRRTRWRSKTRETWSGRPMPRLSRITCSKNILPVTGWSSIWVKENSACRTDISYRYPAPRSASANGPGRIASHLSNSALI